MDNRFIPNNDIIFEAKADAVPYRYRITYRVALICIIIGKCCGKKGCSAIKLQMICAATENLKAQTDLLKLIERELVSETTLIRFDPAVTRALNFALYDDLIFRQTNGLYRLKEKGKKLVNEIYSDSDLMQQEKALFAKLKNRLHEELIDTISSNWRLIYAKNQPD